MTADFTVRGYAAPFNRWTWLADEGVWEQFAPKAFDLSSNIDFRFQHHGQAFASSARKSLVLFQDQFGLGFEAEVTPDCEVWGIIPAIRNSEMGASVNMICDEVLSQCEEVDADGVVCRTINRVKIDHIALEGAPAYQDTPIWLSLWDPDDMRPRLSAAARRWAAGKDSAGFLLPARSTEPRPAAAISAPVTARAARRGEIPQALKLRIDAVLCQRPTALAPRERWPGFAMSTAHAVHGAS